MSLGKAVVAMSGGVDSSVAAALMVEQGWQTVGVTLKLLARAETGFGCCGSPVDVDDAKRVCESLCIPHYVLNLADLFEDKVIKPFVQDYLSARTPNPCVECNRSLKFGYLLALSRAWGARRVATGHYARAENGRLLRARDLDKDQTYFLYSLTPAELSSVSFPIGELTKPEVRERARKLGLKTADKPESQEICFVPGRDYKSFVAARPEAAGSDALVPGEIRDRSGRTLGRHEGVAGYTIGQRRGLGVAAPEPLYVVGLESDSHTVVVGKNEATLCREFTASNVTWTAARPQETRIRASARIRHRHPPAAAAIDIIGAGEARVRFDEPQRAVTPGQAVVFYDEDLVLGGGTIAAREAP
jgi:tRNA-specific 2-thiouridylase